ncbi:MAG: helix-turn-helix domain-containing protein [Saprospiraceae bacterium]|jgi:transcriptional regulator with XRE-family HTH domain|nr:helix-turn-helix domain-containing protein [Saprospiraceae bacterium]
MKEMPIGLKIKKFRLIKGIEVQEMAKELNITERWYRELENGQGKIQTEQLSKILSKLEIAEEVLNNYDTYFSQNNNMENSTNIATNTYHTERNIEISEKLNTISEKFEHSQNEYINHLISENNFLKDQISFLNQILSDLKNPFKPI